MGRSRREVRRRRCALINEDWMRAYLRPGLNLKLTYHSNIANTVLPLTERRPIIKLVFSSVCEIHD